MLLILSKGKYRAAQRQPTMQPRLPAFRRRRGHFRLAALFLIAGARAGTGAGALLRRAAATPVLAMREWLGHRGSGGSRSFGVDGGTDDFDAGGLEFTVYNKSAMKEKGRYQAS